MAESGRGDRKGFEVLIKNLEAIGGMETRVGWFAENTYPDGGPPVAYVAAIQEYGSGPIPPRPFMRPTIAEKTAEWKEKAAKIAKHVLSGIITAFAGMDTLGAVIEGDVRKKIESIDAPPLSPITLMARKYREDGKKVTGKTIGEIAKLISEGNGVFSTQTKPLIETKTLIHSLRHETVKL